MERRDRKRDGAPLSRRSPEIHLCEIAPRARRTVLNVNGHNKTDPGFFRYQKQLAHPGLIGFIRDSPISPPFVQQRGEGFPKPTLMPVITPTNVNPSPHRPYPRLRRNPAATTL